MRYLVFAILAAAFWYFFIRDDGASAAIDPVTRATPEEQFQTLLSGNTVDAEKLAFLCSSYPGLGKKLLSGKQIRIRGTVAEVGTSGINGRRAFVVLGRSGRHRLILVCDLDQYSGPGINFRYLGKFRALGTELLYIVERHSKYGHGTLTKNVVTTQGREVNQFAALKGIGTSTIEFEMVDGPSWAHAQIKED